MRLEDLTIKIFADGANLNTMLKMAEKPYIKGFTTNPTLMNKAGITDYEAFAKDVVREITNRPISFEVFSDEFDEMARQAHKIRSWGENVYVKIPVTNTRCEPAYDLIHRLSHDDVKLNITAIFTLEQVRHVHAALRGGAPNFVSVFAGRIADAGIDPLPIMEDALDMLYEDPTSELLWASPREVFNVVQANNMGCDIITATTDILNKLPNLGKDLDEFSLDTVKMFYNDAQAAGYTL